MTTSIKSRFLLNSKVISIVERFFISLEIILKSILVNIRYLKKILRVILCLLTYQFHVFVRESQTIQKIQKYTNL